MKTIKNFVCVFLVVVISCSENQDGQLRQVGTNELTIMLKENSDFNKYVDASVSNIINLNSLTDNEREHLRVLVEKIEGYNFEASDELYELTHFDVNTFNFYSKVTTYLSKSVLYSDEDLDEVISSAITKRGNEFLENTTAKLTVIDWETYCHVWCTNNAKKRKASMTGVVSDMAADAYEIAIYIGCSDFCMAHPD